MMDAFSQLASTSAVLGGFAFAFLGALIGGDRRSRAVTLTDSTLPAAACFILGIFSFFFALGTSGWIHSRTLGLLSSIIAATAAILTAGILSRFIFVM